MDDNVEDANKTHQYWDGDIDWVLSVEEKKGDEYHEHAFAIEKTYELEVFEDSLPSEFGH